MTLEKLAERLMWIALGVALLLCAIMTETLYAEPLKVRLVYARGPNILGRAQVRQLVDLALYEIEQETGVSASVRRFVVLDKNPYQGMHDDLNDAQLEWASWVLYFRGVSEADINLAVVAPWKVGSTYWLLGYAHQCKRGGTAMATMEPVNQSGADRVEHSYVALKHELMHVVGARHRDTACNLMHSAAISCTPNTPTLPESITEIRNCGGRW